MLHHMDDSNAEESDKSIQTIKKPIKLCMSKLKKVNNNSCKTRTSKKY